MSAYFPNARWIWHPTSTSNTSGHLVSFTKNFGLDAIPTSATVLRISADTRYKLYVNGQYAAIGPARGDEKVWFIDDVEIGHFLVTGANSIHVRVLRLPYGKAIGLPFARTVLPGLLVECVVPNSTVDLQTNESWLCRVEKELELRAGDDGDHYLHIFETATLPSQNDLVPSTPQHLLEATGCYGPWHLQPRAIPHLTLSPFPFKSVQPEDSAIGADDWEGAMLQGQSLHLLGGSKHVIRFLAASHCNAFIRLAIDNLGCKAKVTIRYSEGFEKTPRFYPHLRTKGDRLDPNNSMLIGPEDVVQIDSTQTQVTYEPFWFRTFRFIVLTIQVEAGPGLKLKSFTATQVAYPFNIRAEFCESGNVAMNQMWDVSVRTLSNCTLDAYYDCPFYEQLQYTMDTKASALFHYVLCGDDRLARQAIEHFHRTYNTEIGLTESRAPSHVHQYIPVFSLYWILMVVDHYRFFADAKYVKRFLPVIDGILAHFDRLLDNTGLVGRMRRDHWSFLDWVEGWDEEDRGLPPAATTGYVSIFSMIYSYALKEAAKLLGQVGRPGLQDEYERRAVAVNSAINAQCFDGTYYTDGLAVGVQPNHYSQHAQVFAVLCGAAKPNAGKLLLDSFDVQSSRFGRCSYVFQHFAFRAFAQVAGGVYEQLWKADIWQPWLKMLRDNLSTWEEDTVSQRSDCHAWGSLPIFEFTTEVLGVSPATPGWKTVKFAPRLSLAEEVRGKVAVGSKGTASVAWRKKNGEVKLELILDRPMNLEVHLPGRDIQILIGTTGKVWNIPVLAIADPSL